MACQASGLACQCTAQTLENRIQRRQNKYLWIAHMPTENGQFQLMTLLLAHYYIHMAIHTKQRTWRIKRGKRERKSLRKCACCQFSSYRVKSSLFQCSISGETQREQAAGNLHIFICSILDCFQMQAVKSSSLLAWHNFVSDKTSSFSLG